MARMNFQYLYDIVSGDTITIAAGDTYTTKVINISNASAVSLVADIVDGTNPSFDVRYVAATSENDPFVTPHEDLLFNDIAGTFADMFAPIGLPCLKFIIINNNVSDTLKLRLKIGTQV